MALANIVEDSEHLPELSIHLSRTFDYIGLNALVVERRRHAVLFSEHIENICNDLDLKDATSTSYCFGSQVESATTQGLKSDIDELVCRDNYVVIQDLKEWKPGRLNLLMLDENTAPGFCRLQVIRPDQPLPEKDLRKSFTRDEAGRSLFKNSHLNTPDPQFKETRHGPATTVCGKPDVTDKDIVEACICKKWPRQAMSFTRRTRRGSWPSKSLVKQATKHGVFLVPVGHKLSSSEELEWRISASLAERCLMFSLNIVQIKVYVALKMLVKTFVEPVVRDCISSYHCKTVVLWCSEQTRSKFWCENNLVKCIRKCLYKLFNCIAKGFCPHYIIAEENLFDGKVTSHNRGNLLTIFSYLIGDIGRALLRIRFDDLGQLLQTSIDMPHRDWHIKVSLTTAREVGMAEYRKNLEIAKHKKRFLYKMKPLDDTKSAIEIGLAKLLDVVDHIAALSDGIKKQAALSLRECMHWWIVSMMCSFMVSSKMAIYPGIISMISPLSEESNVLDLLKLASIFYCNENYKEAERILNMIFDHFNKHLIQPVCGCHDRSARLIGHVLYCMVYTIISDGNSSNDKCNNLFAHCVMFSKQEFFSTPKALQNEFFRALGDDTKLRQEFGDAWMDLAIVDCLPCLFYLRYINYRQLQKGDLRKQSLVLLVLCAKTGINVVGHPETAWNLLGTCFELEEDIEAALACYKKSLEIFPRNNAANWHLSSLVYKLITRADSII